MWTCSIENSAITLVVSDPCIAIKTWLFSYHLTHVTIIDPNGCKFIVRRKK